MRKKTLILILITVLSTTIMLTTYILVKLYFFNQRKSSIPLIETIYSAIGAQHKFDSAIVFVGNSMIHRGEWNYRFDKIDKKLPTIINRGIGGNKIEHLMRRLKSNVLSLNPKIIVIEIGTNDLIDISEENKTYKIEYLQESFIQIINSCFQFNRDIKLYFLPIMPIPNVNGDGDLRINTSKKINYELQIICQKYKNVKFIDCFDYFYDSSNNCLFNKYSLAYDLGVGTAHFNDTGNNLFAEIIARDVLSEE